jgi:hypothetical protein
MLSLFSATKLYADFIAPQLGRIGTSENFSGVDADQPARFQ